MGKSRNLQFWLWPLLRNPLAAQRCSSGLRFIVLYKTLPLRSKVRFFFPPHTFPAVSLKQSLWKHPSCSPCVWVVLLTYQIKYYCACDWSNLQVEEHPVTHGISKPSKNPSCSTARCGKRREKKQEIVAGSQKELCEKAALAGHCLFFFLLQLVSP